ncbi:unnamed protein product [Euphydryas editha]|uniref:TIL domain-containing protein n=1 Tax=Euphydryas editha TaxID=104508 RepID=A0AAU9U268_EUPED|nr:unnamed protein product [Euphydryas editha]
MNLKTYTFLCFIIPYLTIGNLTSETQMKRNINEAPMINSTVNIPKVCSPNEVLSLCETCTKFCANKSNVICIEPCKGGCFCDKNLMGDKHGQCAKYEECFRVMRDSYQLPIPYQLSCGDHQVYSSCRRCDKTCTDPNPVCNGSCIAGCFCDEGYLKGPDGRCIKLKDCPTAEITLGNNEVSIDECQPDEVFVWCGWCEGSCSEPAPRCPETTCTQGCLCRPPLLRHYSGLCVEEKDCLPQKCSNPNEEYTCRYGCEARCTTHTQACSRPRRCHLGCHCKRGLFRHANGKCVTANECFEKNNATILSI